MAGLHLVMPMGGRGYRFFKDGYVMPKPLIELNGKPFFFWSVQSVLKFIQPEDIRFVVLKEHVERFDIIRKIQEYYPDALFTVIPEVLPGAVMTCIEGVKEINDNNPILFNDCDHMFICSELNDFCAKAEFSSPDGALMTFTSDEPKFSYAKLDDNGRVICTVEKKVISSSAICGAYYFANKDIFTDAAEKYLHACSYEEFFMSGVYNVLIENGADIRTFSSDVHISFGTPEEYEEAANDRRLGEVDRA